MDRRRFLGLLGASGVISGVPSQLSPSKALNSRDGYIRREPGRWVIGTSVVEKVVTLSDGRLTLTSFKNKPANREYVQAGAISSEVRLTIDGQETTGASGNWGLIEESSYQL